MNPLTPAQVRAKRVEAQQVEVTFHLGKDGVTDAAVAELLGQLQRRKLVKARLLPSATAGGAGNDEVAARLASATSSTLIDVRGHTAVFFRA